MSQPWKPLPYMRRAVKFMLSRGAAGLFLDPGLGKTAISLMTFKVLLDQRLARRWLVVCPLKPAYETWPDEVEKWDDFHGLDLAVLHGPTKDRLLGRRGAQLDVINPEGLPWLFWKLRQRKDWPYDGLLIDESTMFKHTGSERFKLLKKFLGKFRRRYILTGTPTSNGLLNIYGQVYVLDQGNALGEHYTAFRYKYFNPGGPGGFKWRVIEGAEKKIQRKIKHLVIHMSGDDYLQLPPRIMRERFIELPPKVLRQYREMELLLATELLDGTVVTAPSAGTSLGKCRQIANGGVWITDQKRFEQLHYLKAEAVAELIDEMQGQPALVAYEFDHDLERLMKVLGKDVLHIGGGMRPSEVGRIKTLWNEGKLPVLLGQPQSMSKGLNLQKAGRNVIWHSLTYNWEDYDQFVRRVWRQGQISRVFVWHVLARGTVDESIYRILKYKENGQRRFLGALKEDVVKRHAAALARRLQVSPRRSRLAA